LRRMMDSGLGPHISNASPGETERGYIEWSAEIF
jgi:hypothetical protein